MSYSPSPSTEHEPNVLALSFCHPLDDFYDHAGRNLPKIEVVPGPSVPEPYQQLLVHDGDMTPTLEKFYGAAIHLEVLRRERRDNFYFREVVLLTDDFDKRTEFGAIKIFLDLFPIGARNDILAERLPLGTILAKYKIEHTSRPKAFLRVEADQFIKAALQLSGNHVLYGRRNTLFDPQQHALAEIVEILPPAKPE